MLLGVSVCFFFVCFLFLELFIQNYTSNFYPIFNFQNLLKFTSENCVARNKCAVNSREFLTFFLTSTFNTKQSKKKKLKKIKSFFLENSIRNGKCFFPIELLMGFFFIKTALASRATHRPQLGGGITSTFIAV